ncbi:hypothetical protein [Algoriphagus mannitolivorans]|uniref:hypothetical protein n=1 Tax=Algoriphagus mannitolivorans TaxID=226504 RepID=UPI0004188405|nr:hypothetical protein [Algoriphagus mannitolivorans]
MKLKIAVLIFFLPIIGFAQERGAGVRLGEPFSLTYKDFIEDYLSFEVMLGSGGVNSAEYYRKSFENNPPSSNAFYVSHTANRGVSLNFRLALHEDITDMFEIEQGYLLGYAGAGLHLRSSRLNYIYDTFGASGPAQRRFEERSNFDLGPEAFGGAEYYFDDLPISVFAEVGLFIELVDRVNMRGQGGIGVRYLF